MLSIQKNIARDSILLDGFWKFKADPDNIGKGEKWFEGIDSSNELAVPGSWNEQRRELHNYFGKGWYETLLIVPANWAAGGVYFRLGGFQAKSTVWINGVEVAHDDCGSLPIDIDVAAVVRPGVENRITICVDCGIDAWHLPPARFAEEVGNEGFTNTYPEVTYDFFPFGGIHRSVVLYRTAASKRIESMCVVTKSIQSNVAEVSIDLELSGCVEGELRLIIEDSERILQLNGESRATVLFRIESPRLWDLGEGNLYKLHCELRSGELLLDAYDLSFGIRTVAIKGDQFLLNGRPVFLRGFGKHEDYSVIGKGHFRPGLVKDFDLLEWTGSNSFRTSHYPYDEEFYDYADRHGILVIGETPLVGLRDRFYDERGTLRCCNMVRRMIERDRNHPSVVAWSLANEPSGLSERAPQFFKALADTAREIDSERPLTYAGHMDIEHNLAFEHYDFISINKYFGWYENPGRIEGSLPMLKEIIERFNTHFEKPVFVSEFGADAVAGLHRNPPEMFSEEYQAELVEKQYSLLRSMSCCMGAHVWAFADFATAQGINRVCGNRKGVFTRERQPKMAAHRLRQLWAEEFAKERESPQRAPLSGVLQSSR